MITSLYNSIVALGLPQVEASKDKINAGINVILAIFGSVAMLVIAIAGFRYTISQGNPEVAQKAKNTIIYASIGLGVSMLAFVIVNFVVNRVS
jgi:hypothetical protein